MAEKGIVKKFGKKAVLYVLMMVICSGLIGLLQWVDSGEADRYFYFAQAFVLILGITHVFLLYRFIPQIRPGDFWRV